MTLSPSPRVPRRVRALGRVARLPQRPPRGRRGRREARPNLVRLDSGIEPLVRLLEETPRDKLLEEVGARVKKGLAYRDVLAALLLAGVRNVQPRPNVGFKFHAVLVVNSAHQAAMAGPDNERWLPLFWALDNFKSCPGAEPQGERLADEAGGRDEGADRRARPARRSPTRWTTGTWRPPTSPPRPSPALRRPASCSSCSPATAAATSATSATRPSTSPTPSARSK